MVGVDVGFENPTFACLEVNYKKADNDVTGEAATDLDLLPAGPGSEPCGAQVLRAAGGARQHAHLGARRQRRSLRRPRLLGELHHIQEPRGPGMKDIEPQIHCGFEGHIYIGKASHAQ